MKMLKALKRQENLTNDPKLLEISRLNDRAFTRRREGGMEFPEAVSFMLDMCKTSLQTRLNRFYGNVKGGAPISQQAFSKCDPRLCSETPPPAAAGAPSPRGGLGIAGANLI